MSGDYSETQIREALQNCADEPVHIPGNIQHFGWLLAYSRSTQVIAYASDNAALALNRPMNKILDQHVRDLLGREIWHGLQNLLAMEDTREQRHLVGSWSAAEEGRSYLASAWQSGEYIVIEFEEEPSAPLLSAQDLQTQSGLIAQVQSAQDAEALFDVTTRQLRHLTGYDRVMIYRFDQDWNGEVIAEAHSAAVEPFLGLNFPSFDIPAQARAIMARIPLRVISDTDQTPVPISAAHAKLPPLDIALGELRGTSPVHMQYLRNMGSRATMTLSIVIGGTLWGIISFHHRRPKVAPAHMRLILKGFLDVFCLKLGLLTELKFKALSENVDQLQRDMYDVIENEVELSDLLNALGSRLGEAFQACGFYIKSDTGEYSFGTVPDKPELEQLITLLPADRSSPFFTNNIAEMFPLVGESIAPISGASAVFHENDWMLMIFRLATAQTVSWAGDPQKTVEFVEGNARLQPRGSFSTFLAENSGRSKPWTGEDRILVQKLWPLLSAALNSDQKRRYMEHLSRQQELMIDELNHRVRNILALVQAVSSEAKKSQSSLESYSMAIESRIRALAAAHSIGSGTSAKSVDIAEIILQEAKPYEQEAGARVKISGDRKAIVSELAPIFALIIHELMTNAAKYGALSNTSGVVHVVMQSVGDDLEITWRESGGPRVAAPNRQGFGTTLVKRAVPYELGGQSSLHFLEGGVEARVLLTSDILMASDIDERSDYSRPDFGNDNITRPSISKQLTDGVALVVEDNFMISEGITQQLYDLDVKQVEAASSLETALEFLNDATPSFAILDVNLGHGKTSVPVAEVLLDRGVPIVFASGYGELTNIAPRFSKQIVLTKPINTLELAKALARLGTE